MKEEKEGPKRKQMEDMEHHLRDLMFNDVIECDEEHKELPNSMEIRKTNQKTKSRKTEES
jgi:hypothetical protein